MEVKLYFLLTNKEGHFPMFNIYTHLTYGKRWFFFVNETCRSSSMPKVKDSMRKLKSSTPTKTFSIISSGCFFSTCFCFNNYSSSIASSFFSTNVVSCNSPSRIKEILSYFIVILSSSKLKLENSSSRLKELLSLSRMSSFFMSFGVVLQIVPL